MFIYFFTILIIGCFYYLIYHSSLKRIAFVRLSLLFLFFISSFRDASIGADYIYYVSAFKTISVSGTYYMEKGYVLLNRIVALLTDNYIGIAIAVNLILFIPLYYFIVKNVDEEYWGLVIFVFAANPYFFIQSTFNAMRQCCATGIIIVGFNYLIKRKEGILNNIIYIIMVVLAAQFHRVSYCLLILPLVLHIRWTKVKWFIVLAVCLLLRIVNISSLVSVVGRWMRYTTYINYRASKLDNPIYIVFLICIFLFFIYHYDDFSSVSISSKNKMDTYLFSLSFLILALSNDMLYRIYMIIAFCALPGIPVVCQGIQLSNTRVRIKNEEKIVPRLYILYYLVFYFGYIMLLAYNQNSSYIPFKFCF